MSLARNDAMSNNLYLYFVGVEACHIMSDFFSIHVGEVKDVQFISQLAKSCFIKWLGKNADELIIGANILN